MNILKGVKNGYEYCKDGITSLPPETKRNIQLGTGLLAATGALLLCGSGFMDMVDGSELARQVGPICDKSVDTLSKVVELIKVHGPTISNEIGETIMDLYRAHYHVSALENAQESIVGGAQKILGSLIPGFIAINSLGNLPNKNL